VKPSDSQKHRRLLEELERDVDLRDSDDRRQVVWGLIAAGVFLFLWFTFWLAVQTASLLSGHWLPLGAGFKQAPGALLHLYKHFGAPRHLYHKPLRHEVASAWLLYPVFFVFLGVELRYGWRLLRRYKGWGEPEEDRGETGWAEEKDLNEILGGGPLSKRAGPEPGVILGMMNGRRVFLEKEAHALVVAGTRSGKTTGLCIPALLTFPGAIIATSVKNDLLPTIEHRRSLGGEVYVFDPVGSTGLPEKDIAGWSPLETSLEWQGAQRTANSLIEVSSSKKTTHSDGNMEFFKKAGEQILPVLLYAAAVMDENMWRVMNWLHHLGEPETSAHIEAILYWKKNKRALDAWTGFLNTEPRLRSNISATVQAALISYESEAVERNSRHCDIVPERFFDGKPNTLYVCGPMAEQARLEPVFVALIQHLLFWVTEQPAPQEQPVLVVLDEAGNIAALPELPSLISTIGGHNVQIITCWQDFAQMRARYGEQFQTIINNSRAKLALRGVSDPETIRVFSEITGELIETQDSESFSANRGKNRHNGHHQVTLNEGRRHILTPAVIREQPEGGAILVYGAFRPARIKLRLWYKDNKLRELVGEPPLRSASPLTRLSALPRTRADLLQAVRGVFSRRR
jgi:type IV secretion system protein VirD4